MEELQQEIDQLKNDLAKKDKNLKDMSNKIAKFQEDSAEMEQMLEEEVKIKEEEIERLNQEIEEKDELISSLKGSSSTSEGNDTKELEANLEKSNQTIKQLNDQLQQITQKDKIISEFSNKQSEENAEESKQLKSRITELQASFDNLAQSISDKDQELIRLQSQNQENVAQIKENKDRIVRFEEQIASQLKAIQEQQIELQLKQTEIEMKEEQLTSLQQNLNTSQSTIAQLTQTLSERNIELDSSKADHSKLLLEQSESIQDQLREQENNFYLQQSQLNAKINQNTRINKDLSDKIQALQRKERLSANTISDLQTEVNAAYKEIAERMIETAFIKANMQIEQTSLKQIMGQLENELEEQRDQFQMMRLTLSKAEQALKQQKLDSDSEISQMENENDNLKQKELDYQTNIQVLEESLRQIQQKLQEDSANFEAKIIEMTTAYDQLTSLLESANAETARITEEKDSLQSSLIKLAQNLQNSESTNSELSSKLNESINRNEESDKLLNQKSNELASVKGLFEEMKGKGQQSDSYYQTNIQDLEESLRQIQQKLQEDSANFEAKIIEMTTAYDQLTSLLESANAETARITEEKDSLQSSLIELAQNLQNSESTNSELSSKLNESINRNEESDKLLNQKSNELASVKGLFEEMKGKGQQSDSYYLTQIQQSNEQIQILRSELENQQQRLKVSLDNQELEREQLISQLEQLKIEKSQIEANILEIQDKSKSQLEENSRQTTVQENKIESQKVEIYSLSFKINQVSKEKEEVISSLNNKIQEISQEIEQQKLQNEDLVKINLEIQLRLEASSELNNSLTSLNDKLNKLQNDAIQDAKRFEIEYKQIVQSKDEEISQLNNSLQKLQEEFNNIQSELSDLKSMEQQQEFTSVEIVPSVTDRIENITETKLQFRVDENISLELELAKVKIEELLSEIESLKQKIQQIQQETESEKIKTKTVLEAEKNGDLETQLKAANATLLEYKANEMKEQKIQNNSPQSQQIDSLYSQITRSQDENEQFKQRNQESFHQDRFEEFNVKSFEDPEQLKQAINSELIKKQLITNGHKLFHSALYSKAPRMTSSPYFEIKPNTKQVFLAKQSKVGFDKSLGLEKFIFDDIIYDLKNLQSSFCKIFFEGEEKIKFFETSNLIIIHGAKKTNKKIIFYQAMDRFLIEIQALLSTQLAQITSLNLEFSYTERSILQPIATSQVEIDQLYSVTSSFSSKFENMKNHSSLKEIELLIQKIKLHLLGRKQGVNRGPKPSAKVRDFTVKITLNGSEKCFRLISSSKLRNWHIDDTPSDLLKEVSGASKKSLESDQLLIDFSKLIETNFTLITTVSPQIQFYAQTKSTLGFFQKYSANRTSALLKPQAEPFSVIQSPIKRSQGINISNFYSQPSPQSQIRKLSPTAQSSVIQMYPTNYSSVRRSEEVQEANRRPIRIEDMKKMNELLGKENNDLKAKKFEQSKMIEMLMSNLREIRQQMAVIQQAKLSKIKRTLKRTPSGLSINNTNRALYSTQPRVRQPNNQYVSSGEHMNMLLQAQKAIYLQSKNMQPQTSSQYQEQGEYEDQEEEEMYEEDENNLQQDEQYYDISQDPSGTQQQGQNY